MIIAPFQGLFDGGFITRGCAPLYPGLSHFTPSGLRNQRPSFFVKAGNPWILKERMDSRIRWGDEGAGVTKALGPFGKLRDKDSPAVQLAVYIK